MRGSVLDLILSARVRLLSRVSEGQCRLILTSPSSGGPLGPACSLIYSGVDRFTGLCKE